MINMMTIKILTSANQYSISPYNLYWSWHVRKSMQHHVQDSGYLTPTRLIARINTIKMVDHAGSGMTGSHHLMIVAAAANSVNRQIN